MSIESIPPAIDINRVTKAFGRGKHQVTAIRELSLVIPVGEVVALVGANGAGKTTLLDMVLGLTEPTTGTIKVFGGFPAQAARTSRMGAVLQTGGLLPDLTVAETVRAIAGLHALDVPLTRAVEQVLEQARLTNLKDRKVRLCSGGEQQRIRFALAILPRPELLILDEPTTGMDIYARHEFWQAMRNQASKGQTIIFATHYLEEAQRYADRVVLLQEGRITANGTVPQVQGSYPSLDDAVLSYIAPDFTAEGFARS